MRYILLAMALLLGACGLNPAANTTNIVTPTVQESPEPALTATMIFSRELGMGGFPAITLEQIGLIPANARVNVSSAMWQDEWVYSIVDENGNYENARESQLAYGPDVTPGAPTPTSAFRELLQQGTVYARTLVDVEGIPAGTIVRLGPSHNGDGEIVYEVYNDELGLRGEITESQLEFVELEPYVMSTEVPSPTPQ
jgi:hypothetical protein